MIISNTILEKILYIPPIMGGVVILIGGPLLGVSFTVSAGLAAVSVVFGSVPLMAIGV